MNISTKINFEIICKLLEDIHESKEIRLKEKHLKRYIDKFKEFKEKFCRSHENVADSSFYCVLRCLIPNSDTARQSYGIKVHSLGKIYIKILNLSPNSDDAQMLTYQKNKISGDYAEVVYNVMKVRANPNFSKLTLADVEQILDKFAQEDRRSAEREFTTFIETASALEQKWFIRIMLKKINLGIGEHKVFSIYHPSAKDFYTRYTDLKRVCESVESGEIIDVNDIVTPFQHIRPMLCKHMKITDLSSLFETDTLYTETKMDGERFQMHMANETFKYISRNGKDYTKFFGRNVTEGNLTPFICSLLNMNVKSIILDGEMMVYDKSMASYRVKGENFDVKHLEVGGNLRPCLVVYDILYLNGVSCLDSPYIERFLKIAKNLTESVGVLQISRHTKLTTTEHFQSVFNAAINKNEEGIVVKQQTSLYKPGSRNSGWFKFKADYIEGLTSDFDLLIIGGCYNDSKKYIDSYLVGVLKTSANENGIPVIYSIGKVSSGCSLQERKLLNQTLNKYWCKMCQTSSTCLIKFGASLPDVWIEPKDSIILQIKASELYPSNAFQTPYALRFPRIQAIRNDKLWNECMTLEEYENYYKGTNGVKKITKRQLSSGDFSACKRARVEKSNKSNPYAAVDLTINNTEIIPIQAFSGKNFCILSGCKDKKLNEIDLCQTVAKFGGKIVQNPLINSQCFNIAGDITKKVQLLMEKAYYNIISLDWLLNSFELAHSACTLSITPRDLICSTPEMEKQLNKMFDKYGDSYTNHVCLEDLKKILNEMPEDRTPIQHSEIAQMENVIYGEEPSPNCFREISGYFYSPSEHSHNMEIAQMLFEFRGGRVLNLIDLENMKKINFIFVDLSICNDSILKNKLIDLIHENRLENTNFQVMSIDWITSCHNSNSITPNNEYIILSYPT